MALAPLRASLCALLGALPALADPSPAFLVKDLDTAPVGLPESLGPIRDAGDTVYMPVATNETGLELGRATARRPGPRW